MTVVEREVVVPVVTERERRASILEDAALEIEVRGWSSRVFCDAAGKVCALGALHAAVGLDPRYGNPYETAGSAWGCTTAPGPLDDLAVFNDTHTASEVTFLLRWRAAEIRDGL